MSKAYERTENGVTTTVDQAAGLAEINDAMMGGQRTVREMSSISRTDYAIAYKDGRSVRLVLVEAPAPRTDRAADDRRIVTVKGKRYVVGTVTPARPHTPDAKTWIPRPYVSYWAERNGERFGATRSASENNKPGTVGAAIWAQVAS